MRRVFDYLFNEIPYGFILFPVIILICFSCEVCHAQVDMPFDETRVFADAAEIDPAPIAKPTKPPIVVKPSPTPVPQEFVTKKSVVKVGDKAQYATEKIIQNPTSVSAVKGERWVKTYILWTRGDGVVVPLSQGWSKAEDLSEVAEVVTKPKVEVFKK